MPADTTKSYKDCCIKLQQTLTGNLFGRTYDLEEIKNSISAFSLAAFNNDYEPENPILKISMQKTTINIFLMNQYAAKGPFSYFKKYLTEVPVLIETKKLLEDKHPVMTERMKKTYCRKVFGGRMREFTVQQQNCFIRAAAMLYEFTDEMLAKNRLNSFIFDGYGGGVYGAMCEFVFETIDKRQAGDWSRVTPAWLCSKPMYNNHLPGWLYEQAALNDTTADYISSSSKQQETAAAIAETVKPQRQVCKEEENDDIITAPPEKPEYNDFCDDVYMREDDDDEEFNSSKPGIQCARRPPQKKEEIEEDYFDPRNAYLSFQRASANARRLSALTRPDSSKNTEH
jgi:hypothetical protein